MQILADIVMGKGYSFNSGTYQTLILGISEAKNDGLGKIRKAIMPEKLERSKFKPAKRGNLWWNAPLQTNALPFPGADRSVVQRSQYFDAVENKAHPVTVECYMSVASKLNAYLLMAWLVIFSTLVQYEFTRKLLQAYPGFCSGYLFKETGPTRQQAKEASFTYWVFGKGWTEEGANAATATPPTKTVVARCDGPDAGYIATAGCVLSSALTILLDSDKLPHEGGVFTTASAFKNTKIYERLAEHGITFRIDESVHPTL
uniref:Sacchrp_dh_C domain-containing protein n=1 Tax=Panagrellus redivivus TaxID=6233 RepID=A0A7E4WC38_PANRE